MFEEDVCKMSHEGATVQPASPFEGGFYCFDCTKREDFEERMRRLRPSYLQEGHMNRCDLEALEIQSMDRVGHRPYRMGAIFEDHFTARQTLPPEAYVMRPSGLRVVLVYYLMERNDLGDPVCSCCKRELQPGTVYRVVASHLRRVPLTHPDKLYHFRNEECEENSKPT